MGKREQKLSEKLAAFLSECDSCGAKCRVQREVISGCEKKTTDYLHEIELEPHTRPELTELTIAERANRQDRRRSKNILEQYEPLEAALANQNVTAAIKVLKDALGKIRKVESIQPNRRYYKRSSQ